MSTLGKSQTPSNLDMFKIWFVNVNIVFVEAELLPRAQSSFRGGGGGASGSSVNAGLNIMALLLVRG